MPIVQLYQSLPAVCKQEGRQERGKREGTWKVGRKKGLRKNGKKKGRTRINSLFKQ